MEFIAKLVIMLVWTAGMMVLVALTATIPVWLLWNWIAPDVFGLNSVSLVQAFGLVALTSLLLGGRVRVERGND